VRIAGHPAEANVDHHAGASRSPDNAARMCQSALNFGGVQHLDDSENPSTAVLSEAMQIFVAGHDVFRSGLWFSQTV
jgi:hypothetical protein